MKNPFRKALLLGTTIFMFGCSSSGDYIVDNPPPENILWSATANVKLDSITISNPDDGVVSRAAFFGGNTDRFMTAWDQGDIVRVYKGNTEVGTMVPDASSYGALHATLTGTLTGPFAQEDELKLYLPNRDMDYRGQVGAINDMSLKYSFQWNTSSVESAQDNILSLSDVDMNHLQSYWRMMLTDESGKRLHMEQLEISAESNKLVLTETVDGVATYGNLVINATQTDLEYPSELFVAVRTNNATADTWHFKAVVDGNIYIGPSDRALTYKPTNGKLANIIRQMKKTTAASTLTITAIPDKVFTGYAIEPTLEVKDGETTLTLDTDYSVAYTDNVNVGTATATITGLAESGATCTTPYLGTQAKTFSIVQATPVIVMDATTMTLVNNGTQNTATRTVTRVFIDNNGNGTWDEGTDYDITALCTVTYSTDNDAVATVNETSGLVTAAGFGTTTITATVVGATNWTSQTATYTVNVEQEVNGQNTVNPWTSGGEPEGGKIYVE